MTTKYHISPTTGRPNKCYAVKRACPIGGAVEHYSTKEDARKAYESFQRLSTVAQPIKRDRAEFAEFPSDAEETMLFLVESYKRFPDPAISPSGHKVPPVKTDFELKKEEEEINKNTRRMDARSLLRHRVTENGVILAEVGGEYAVLSKEPDYAEVRFSTDLARKYLGMPARKKTDSDETAPRLGYLELLKAKERVEDARKRGDNSVEQYEREYDQLLSLQRKLLKNVRYRS